MACSTVSQILNAAGEIFAQKGFEATTVREICSQAGVNVASVNYHFGDKERLYIEAVKSARSVLEERFPLADLAEYEPTEALRVLIQTLALRLLSRDVESWRHELLVREFTNPSRACEEMIKESIVPFMEKLYGVIRKLLPNVEEHTIRQLALSIISQCAYYRLQARVVEMLTPADQYERHFTPKVLADHITRFSIAAIRTYDSVETISHR